MTEMDKFSPPDVELSSCKEKKVEKNEINLRNKISL